MYVDLSTGALGGGAILQVSCEGLGFGVTKDQAIELAKALCEWAEKGPV
jgi:hypothetical protein